MSDTTVTTESPTLPTPLPNDAAARSPTGEILDRTVDQPKDPSLSTQTTDPTTKTTSSDGDGKTADPKSTETKPATDPKAVPEKYEFKAPEGIILDPKLEAEISPVLKEAGVTQENAQKLFDYHVKALQAAAKAPTDTVETMRADWRTKVTADSEIKAAVNGDKTGIDAVKLDIGRALTHLPEALRSEFKDAMDLTGAGDHPAFVKAIWALSKLVTEGKHVSGAGPSPHGQIAPGASAKPSAAKSLFPNLP